MAFWQFSETQRTSVQVKMTVNLPKNKKNWKESIDFITSLKAVIYYNRCLYLTCCQISSHTHFCHFCQKYSTCIMCHSHRRLDSEKKRMLGISVTWPGKEGSVWPHNSGATVVRMALPESAARYQLAVLYQPLAGNVGQRCKSDSSKQRRNLIFFSVLEIQLEVLGCLCFI